LTEKMSRRDILGDNTKSWSESLKRPLSYKLLTPRKRTLLDQGGIIDIEVGLPIQYDQLSILNATQPSTSTENENCLEVAATIKQNSPTKVCNVWFMVITLH
jgi:hypothetical protein